MRLPPDHSEIIATGVATLRSVGSTVRAAATTKSDEPELWLVVRDLDGLANRLADLDDQEWRDGFATMFFTGQDLGVLDELLERGGLLQATNIVSLTGEQATSLARLREFLQRYCDRS